MPTGHSFTAIIKRDGPWWIGWIGEIAGVNSQGASRDELMLNPRSALAEAIEMNRQEALDAAREDFGGERILL